MHGRGCGCLLASRILSLKACARRVARYAIHTHTHTHTHIPAALRPFLHTKKPSLPLTRVLLSQQMWQTTVHPVGQPAAPPGASSEAVSPRTNETLESETRRIHLLQTRLDAANSLLVQASQRERRLQEALAAKDEQLWRVVQQLSPIAASPCAAPTLNGTATPSGPSTPGGPSTPQPSKRPAPHRTLHGSPSASPSGSRAEGGAARRRAAGLFSSLLRRRNPSDEKDGKDVGGAR